MASVRRVWYTEFAARGMLCGDRSAFAQGRVSSPRMARYRQWRYAQSANFAFGEGGLLLAYVGVRIPAAKGKKKDHRDGGLFSFV